MANAKILDTGSNLLITAPAEELVNAILEEMISRGASIVARPSRLGSNWTASCTKPIGFQDETLPSAYNVGEATKNGVLQTVKIHEAGNHLIISGKSKQSVQAAIDELQKLGTKSLSSVALNGDIWIASCENPKVAASECVIDNFGAQFMITGPSVASVEGKIRELAETGAKLVSVIEQDSKGNWVAVCDASGPRTW
jgi:hypothetical protein